MTDIDRTSEPSEESEPKRFIGHRDGSLPPQEPIVIHNHVSVQMDGATVARKTQMAMLRHARRTPPPPCTMCGRPMRLRRLMECPVCDRP